MNRRHIGILHPGAMGVSLAATARSSGHAVYWASAGRSPDTRKRARANELVELETLEALCDRCSTVISVCPPNAAMTVAERVLACSFTGLFADVNAISPRRAIDIGRRMDAAGVTFVDGGIIGGPAWTPGSTWLYLSGAASAEVAACFAGGPLETEVIGDAIGQASALKMCFAAHSKGTAALRCATVAAAENLGVRDALERQWSRDDAEQAQRILNGIRGVTAKAWRFAGEMDEIAETLESAGLPDGFHRAAGEVYRRMTRFKDADPIPRLEDVLDALLNPDTGVQA